MKTKATNKELVSFYDRRKGYQGDRRKIGAYAVFAYWAGSVEFRRGYWFPMGTGEVSAFKAAPDFIEVEL